MDDKLMESLESELLKENPLAGVALRCPPSPARSATLATLTTRRSQEDKKMNWIARWLHGQTLALQVAAVAVLALGFVALCLLLPFASGVNHAPAALADEGGYVVVCPLPRTSPPASTPDARTQQVVDNWTRQANAKRRASGQHALNVSSEVIVDVSGTPAAQFSLPGANPAEARELAQQVGATSGQAAPQVIAVAPGNGDAITQVKPLDDPANPYRGQYSDIDRWIYSHAWSLEQLKDWRKRGDEARHAALAAAGLPSDSDAHVHWDAKATAALRYMTSEVDKDGWMKPVASRYDPFPADSPELTGMTLFERETLKAHEAVAEAGEFTREKIMERAEKVIYIWASPANEAQFKEFQGAVHLPDPANTPQIPGWLAANPPFLAVLVPNGEVVTYGALGETLPPLTEAQRHAATMPNYSGWYRFSADGKLLEKNTQWGQMMMHWVDFYWPDAWKTMRDTDLQHALSGQRHEGSYWVTMSKAPLDANGEPDYAGRTPVAAYAYDRTPLDLNAPVPAKLLTCRFLLWSQVKPVYEAQQKQQVWFGKLNNKP